MSSDDPRNGVLSILSQAVLEAIKESHPILRFFLAIIILIIILAGVFIQRIILKTNPDSKEN